MISADKVLSVIFKNLVEKINNGLPDMRFIWKNNGTIIGNNGS
jgi:hypothetical protein